MIIKNNTISTIDVAGEGIVRVVPDEVTINIRVEHTGDKSEGLKEQNDEVIQRALKFVRDLHIPDVDIRTELLNLSKNYDYNTKTYSFSATQSLSVKLRDINVYEEFMKGILDSGVNRIDGISFSSSEREALESKARKKAIENAKIKAVEYASVLNQSVGKAVSISEFQNPVEPRPMAMRSAMKVSDSSGGGNIPSGEIEIQSTVYVSFLLD